MKRIVFAVLALAALGLGIWLARTPSSEEAAMAPATDAPAVQTSRPRAIPSKEIQFKESLLIHHDGISIDGAELTIVPCEVVPQLFGFLKIDNQTMGELVCSTENASGIRLGFPDATGDMKSIELAQIGTDGPESWDSRSLIHRGADGALRIETQSLSSYDNLDDVDQPAACAKADAVLTWDKATKDFVTGPQKGEARLSRFTPPINVVNDCLDTKGQWKGN